MQTKIVTLSPQGQISIPKEMRRKLVGNKYVLEMRDEIILMTPCEVRVDTKNSFASKALVEVILDLSAEEKAVFDVVRKLPCSTDVIIEKTSFDISKVNVLLVQLEFKSVVRRNRSFLWEAAPLS